MLQNRLILFCYAYVAGIVTAMLWPIDPAGLPVLDGLTVVAFLAGAALLYGATRRRPGTAPAQPSPLFPVWPLFVLPALLLGYARHLHANTRPDTRLGLIRVAPGSSQINFAMPLADTSRLRLVKTDPVAGDFRVRLHGELEARVPERDEAGRPRLDEQGRWLFRRVRVPQQSEWIVVARDDRVGASYVVEQPFSRLTAVEVLDTPGPIRLELHRISNHIASFVRPGRNQAPVTVLGRITASPDVYDFKTVLAVTPYFIQHRTDGPFFRVEGGDIRVTVTPDITGYPTYADRGAYGHDVLVRGTLSGARPRANPGGFDARQYLQNHDIFGQISLFQAPDQPAPILSIAPNGEPRRGHWLVEFSLELRDRLLLQIKKTMPYPESAFLGGVTLGLRYGLQNARYQPAWRIGSRPEEPDDAVAEYPAEDYIVEQFRASGVNHVLAVSGLHVTIITALLLGIMGLVRVPRRVSVPFIILCLVIFAIITGARPSTLRAVIMNSMFLLIWAYLNQNLASSALLGVPVAAFLILLHNPLMVVDPSFTLSFGAILSLALLTKPFYDLLARLRGNGFLVFLLAVIGTTALGVYSWALLTRPDFLLAYALGWVVLAATAGWLTRRRLSLPESFAYTRLPLAVGLFLAAQFGIQIGMMVPLSAYYFTRWPFAGAYANLLAIPLIGVVVQLGVMAGLLGMIPVIGPPIALVLNAANWLFSSFFLWIGYAAARAFPYPFVRRPTEWMLVSYYLLLAAFIWRAPLWNRFNALGRRLGWTGPRGPALLGLALVVIVLVPFGLRPRAKHPGELQVTVLSVGYGSSILVETPAGRNILIDGGYVEFSRGRRNEAIRTILPFLSHRGIRRLDALVLTSPLPEHAAGLGYILPQCAVGTLYLPGDLAGLTSAMPFESFATRFPAPTAHRPDLTARMYRDLVRDPLYPERASLAKALEPRGHGRINRWAGWAVNVQPLTAGTMITEENVNGRTFRLDVVQADDWSPTEFPIENRSVALRLSYGDFAMLLPGPLHYEGQQRLARNLPPGQRRAGVLIVPHHGTALPGGTGTDLKHGIERALATALGPLIEAVNPDYVINEFGNPRPVLEGGHRDTIHVMENTTRFLAERLGADSCLSTDKDMAVFIRSDGVGYQVTTQARQTRADGDAEDAVSDLEVGL
jgi:ComEC/Rec2-related protein